MDEISVRAGDPFDYAGAQRNGQDDEEDRSCVCYSGVVYLTYEEAGYEWTEPMPCRRCSD